MCKIVLKNAKEYDRIKSGKIAGYYVYLYR